MIQVPYEVSKFLSIQMLLSPLELEELFSFLGKFSLFDNSRVQSAMVPTTQDDFLKNYTDYFDSLKGAEKVPISAYAMTKDQDSLVGVDVADGRVLIKPKEPIIQLREHTFIYGQDEKFHSNVHGGDVVRWGLEFKFPQIFVDPETKKVHQVLREDRFTNGALFRKCMKWMRHNTKPAPFKIQGVLKRATFRIGLDCISSGAQFFDLQKFSIWRSL